MNKKVSLGAAICFMAIAAAVTFTITMYFSLNIFNSKIANVTERDNFYDKIEEIDTIVRLAFQVNKILQAFFLTIGIKLVDFKLEFGRLSDGTIVLADEISPDTCRLWDKETNEKLDKDRFRRDLGNVEGAYQEVMGRLLGKQP